MLRITYAKYYLHLLWAILTYLAVHRKRCYHSCAMVHKPVYKLLFIGPLVYMLSRIIQCNVPLLFHAFSPLSPLSMAFWPLSALSDCSCLLYSTSTPFLVSHSLPHVFHHLFTSFTVFHLLHSEPQSNGPKFPQSTSAQKTCSCLIVLQHIIS